MLRFFYLDMRYRLLCLKTQDKATLDNAARNLNDYLLSLFQPGLPGPQLSGPKWAWWTYKNLTWALYYASCPLRKLRGW